MSVFTETSSSWRDLRVLPSFVPPLRRLNPQLANSAAGEAERYEVVVIGAGPAGLFLTTLLARYGLSDKSLVCFDSKPGTLKAGQADGLQPRTLEVFQSLDLAHEILTESRHMSEVAFWNPKKNVANEASSGHPLFQTLWLMQDSNMKSPFIKDESLRRYSNRGIVRSTDFEHLEIDPASEFPLNITLSPPTNGANGDASAPTRTVRAKYLVGADGAHSRVRKSMGLKLEAERILVSYGADNRYPDPFSIPGETGNARLNIY